MVIICNFGTKMAARYPCDHIYPITLIIMRNAENNTCSNSYKNRTQLSITFLRKILMAIQNLTAEKHFPTCFKFLNSSLLEFPACMLVDITSFAKDFELPGLPTTNNGIRSSAQTAIIKTFSLSAVFLAIFWSSSTSCKNAR